jgi:hypothetical protein
MRASVDEGLIVEQLWYNFQFNFIIKIVNWFEYEFRTKIYFRKVGFLIAS